MKFWIKSALVIIPALVLLGCSTSGDIEDESSADEGQAMPAKTASSSAATSGIGGAGSATGKRMRPSPSVDSGSSVSNEDFFKSTDGEGNALLATRVVYFDFDKSDIKSEAQAVLRAHGQHLAANPQASVTLEGHCDERGTREYNIALGERRAKAVQRVLTLHGASGTQIRLVSYGEERPASLGHDEEAWVLNRRTEIVYK